MSWEDDQKWEQRWWGDCLNTWGEEQKQRHYAERMGLVELSNSQFSFYYNLDGKTILDIGGGPVSLLLKCVNFGVSMVIDPLSYPEWIAARYKAAGIDYYQMKGEDLDIALDRPDSADYVVFGKFDEVWIYNVLQHVVDPKKIIQNARRAGKIIRLFEWLEIGIAPGHPHNLLEDKMNEWLGGQGKTGFSGGGKEYYGIFLGDTYEKE